MNFNQNYIGVIALLASVFFAGAYLRGESLRKKIIKAEIEQIQTQQQEILKAVKAINESARLRDQQLLGQIDSTYAYIDKMNHVLEDRRLNIRKINEQMEEIQEDMDENRKKMNEAAQKSFQFGTSPVANTDTP